MASIVHLPSITASGDTIADETAAVMKQIEELLSERGLSKDHIVKVDSVLADMKDLVAFNAAYDACMVGVSHLPAQILCQAAVLPGGARVQLTATASTLPKERIDSAVAAPAPVLDGGLVLPFSPVVRAGSIVWLSGFLNYEHKGIEAQTRAIMSHIEKHLATVGLTFANITNVQTVLADIGELASFNAVYNEILGAAGVVHCPAQIACQPAGICGGSFGARVELAATASTVPIRSTASAVAAGDKVSRHGELALPFSPVAHAGDMAWLSGVLDVTMADDVRQQAAASVDKLSQALVAEQLSVNDIVYACILLKDLADLPAVQSILDSFYDTAERKPACTVLQPARLCLDAKVEIAFHVRTT